MISQVIDSSWNPILSSLYQPPLDFLNTNILPNIKYYPEKENIFRVFKTPVNKVKVVILGQDPYPNPGDAIGLSFVNGTSKVPASLRIIKQELNNEGFENVDIHKWEQQGVFLLNTALTVESGKAGSHLKYWQNFTQNVVRFLSYTNPTIWLLWGKKAQEYKNFIYKPYVIKLQEKEFLDNLPMVDYNFILESAHPAAETYSGGKAGFYGNNHFKIVNNVLLKKNLTQINW